MEGNSLLGRLKAYNRTITRLTCSELEKVYINYIEECNYFYRVNIVYPIQDKDMETFIRRNKGFKGLLKEHAEALCTYLRHIYAYTCNTGTIRMDIRSSKLVHYEQRILQAIGCFYVFYGAGLHIKDAIYGEYRQLMYNQDISSVIAVQLLLKKQEAIQYCTDVLLSENNTAVLTRDVIVAIEKSENEMLQNMLTKVLLAASLQEGLRQSILETADEYQLSYFLTLLNVIAEHNLLRFSSVKRSVLTWIGIGYELVEDKEISIIFDHIYRFYYNKMARIQAYQSENPLLVYIALYCLGAQSIDGAIQDAVSLLHSERRTTIASALIYLKMSRQFDVCAYQHLLSDYHNDDWIMALYISECCHQTFNNISEINAQYLFDQIEQQASALKATQTYTSKGFAWFQITISKTMVTKCLFQLLCKWPNPTAIQRLLPYIASGLYQKDLEVYMNIYFPQLDEQVKKGFLVKEIISTNTTLQPLVEKEYCKRHLSDDDMIQLEERLKSKNEKARASIVRILSQQGENQISESFKRLFASSVKTMKEAALELQRNAPHVFHNEVQSISILGKDVGFGLYIPSNSFKFQTPQCLTIEKKGLLRKEHANVDDIFLWNKVQVIRYLKKWSDRICAHEQDEYYNGYEYRQIKGGYFYPLDYKTFTLDALPLANIWRMYLKEDKLPDDQLFELRFLLEACHDEIALEKTLQIPNALFTIRYIELNTLPYFDVIERILTYYYYEREQQNHVVPKVLRLWELIVHYSKPGYYLYTNYNNTKEKHSICTMRSMTLLLNQIPLQTCDDEAFKKYFPIYYQGYGKFNLQSEEDVYYKFNIPPLILSRAVILGCIYESDMIEQIMNTHCPKLVEVWGNRSESQLFSAYRDAYFEGRGVYGKPQLNEEDYHGNVSLDVIRYLRSILDIIANQMIQMESTRLNEISSVTPYMRELYVVRGMKHMIQAMLILDHENIKRIDTGDDRISIFTNIIRRSYPTNEDHAEILQLKNFASSRLVEVAMLAPQWIDMINDVLQWDGFKDACYYFIAHMKTYDIQQKKAEIVYYTDLEPEELNDGAFDMKWCKRIYEHLGETRFKMIYQSSKFLCENAFHTRARKYADACLSKTKKETFYSQAKEKRNKDALNAYCICPIEHDQDILERYLYVQQFMKEAKKFGAQRQASEKRAAEIALLNLARNSRFETITRLSWMMEREMITQNLRYLEKQNMDGIYIWIAIDDQGRNNICIEKNKKRLKNIPTALKKHPYCMEIKEMHHRWNEQYRRSRNMLEEAMEERTLFQIEELYAIMENPIVAPMLQLLVLEHDGCFGFYEHGKLKGLQETCEFHHPVRIAHAYDLFEHQQWQDYQAYLFKQHIVQPFKQIFRELYVKLEDEYDQHQTRRYSGYQIQPKKAAAVLKGRKWNVSYENGLERFYHKENLSVHLYAEADWFSPSDIEAPSIEYVSFYSIKEHKPVPIKEINAITFSEIMRDLDLAVSTCYIGGVDPTTSFSTMELRRTIVQYTCRLMKLENVSVEEHFVNIKGSLNDYSVHLGSGTVHQTHGGAIHMIAVQSGQRGKLYVPFLDEDPKMVEIISKVILLAQDTSLKDPTILHQIISRNR